MKQPAPSLISTRIRARKRTRSLDDSDKKSLKLKPSKRIAKKPAKLILSSRSNKDVVNVIVATRSSRSRSHSSRSSSNSTPSHGNKTTSKTRGRPPIRKASPSSSVPSSTLKKAHRTPSIDQLDIADSKDQLNLILDLDETLVNSLWRTSENADTFDRIKRSHQPGICYLSYSTSGKNSHKDSKGNTKEKTEVLCALRPQLLEFLEKVNQYYTVYVYSHGRVEYVQALLEKINPRRDIFDMKHRVFRNEGQVIPKSKKEIRNIIPISSGNGINSKAAILSRTIIVDDYFDVWEEAAQKNIILVKRWQPINKNRITLSPYSLGQGNVQFPSESQSSFEDLGQDNRSSSYLSNLANHLKSIALSFSKRSKKDVRHEITQKASAVLAGVPICFELLKSSRKGEKYIESLSFIVQQLGAHVVSKTGTIGAITVDCQRGRNNSVEGGIKVVDMQWLVDCFFANKQLDRSIYTF